MLKTWLRPKRRKKGGNALDPYQYPAPGALPKDKANRIKKQGIGDPLTGIVSGKPASDLEEYYARALRGNARVEGFRFSVLYSTPFTLPGEQNEIDFFVEAGGTWPIELDGEIAHKTAEQISNDDDRDNILNEELAKDGINPIQRIDGTEYKDQEDMDRWVLEHF